MSIARCAFVLSLLAGAAHPATAQSPFDARRLTPRSDSFAVFMQGRAVGGMRETIVRTPEGYQLTSAQQMAGMSQTTLVTFSPTLEMRGVKQTGKVRGADMSIDVTYAKGRAIGSATTPGSQGLKTIAVDATMVSGAVDDNLLQGLLHTLPLAAGKTFVVPVFSSGTGTTASLTITVTGAETVTVPAGTFDAWKLDISGGQVPVQFWVTRKSPRVVKLGFAGAPMSFELVK